MRFLDAHTQLLLAVLVLLVVAALVVPRLLRSATSGDPFLSLCGIYVVGIGALSGELPRSHANWANVLSSVPGFTGVMYLLVVLAITRSLRASWSRGSAYWALMVYAMALILSGLTHDSLARNLWILPLMATIVSSTQSLTVGRLIRHLRIIGRIITGASLYLALTDYASVQFTDNGRTLLGFAQLSGATPHPNVLGAVAAFALVFELVPSDGRRGIGNPRLVTSACCLMAQSHAGWFMALLGLLVMLLGRRKFHFGNIALV